MDENKIRTLFEDQNIVAIHKPPGIPFHLDQNSTTSEQSIVQFVRAYFKSETLYPVHRLDKGTSGIMIFAKSKTVNSELSQMFAERKIEKYYLALSDKKPKKKQGSVVGDMNKSRNGAYIIARSKENPAITRFKSFSITNESQYTTSDLNKKQRWLHVLKIDTGKTHQIRVALKSLGSAILGDERYKGNSADRLYLHAFRKRFYLNGQLYEITDPDFIGDEFQLNLINREKFVLPEKLDWPKGSFQIEKMEL